MDRNSPKVPETGMAEVSALDVLLEWVDQTTSSGKFRSVTQQLAGHARRAYLAGNAPTLVDADTLRLLVRDAEGGAATDIPASRWLSSTDLSRWWDARSDQISAACRQRGLDLTPTLKVLKGGGRGNPTEYLIEFLPLGKTSEAGTDAALPEMADPRSNVVRYQAEAAKAVWWLRLIIGSTPFRMRSTRGYLILSVVIVDMLTIAALWGLVFWSWRVPRPVTTADLLLILMAAVISLFLWKTIAPLFRLGTDRLTVANDRFLAHDQMHGQFRFTRDAHSRVLGGWFSLQRYWGVCPTCAGEVEVDNGGVAFPGRLVGRCGDSPLEHVYSFDPVRMEGRGLFDDA